MDKDIIRRLLERIDADEQIIAKLKNDIEYMNNMVIQYGDMNRKLTADLKRSVEARGSLQNIIDTKDIAIRNWQATHGEGNCMPVKTLGDYPNDVSERDKAVFKSAPKPTGNHPLRQRDDLDKLLQRGDRAGPPTPRDVDIPLVCPNCGSKDVVRFYTANTAKCNVCQQSNNREYFLQKAYGISPATEALNAFREHNEKLAKDVKEFAAKEGISIDDAFNEDGTFKDPEINRLFTGAFQSTAAKQGEFSSDEEAMDDYVSNNREMNVPDDFGVEHDDVEMQARVKEAAKRLDESV